MPQNVIDRTITAATDGDGDFTGTADGVVGYLEEIEFVIGTIASGAATVTISLSGRPSGVDLTLLTLTNPTANATYRLRLPVHNATGAAIGAERPFLVGTPKVVVASGGATKTGYVHFKVMKV